MSATSHTIVLELAPVPSEADPSGLRRVREAAKVLKSQFGLRCLCVSISEPIKSAKSAKSKPVDPNNQGIGQ